MEWKRSVGMGFSGSTRIFRWRGNRRNTMKKRAQNTSESDNPVERLYGRRALRYERLFVERLGWGKALETFFNRSPYLQPNSKVLDAGCGTGAVTIALARSAARMGRFTA